MSFMVDNKLINQIMILVSNETQLYSMFLQFNSKLFEFWFKSLTMSTLIIKIFLTQSAANKTIQKVGSSPFPESSDAKFASVRSVTP